MMQEETGGAPLVLERSRKEAFVSVLVHELRQPLAALLAAVEVVRITSNSPTARRATEIMTRQIHQMNRLMEDLLDETRWAHGKMTLRRERLDLREVMKEAALDVAGAVAQRGHALVVDPGLEALWVDADRQRIHQVLSNLLRNAVKYTDPGGRIELTAKRGPMTMTVHVSDSGRGIEREALPHVFDLFSQERPTEGEGLGIGLSVVRGIIVLHGGRIVARSDGPGTGSEFIITLPTTEQPAAAV